MKKYVIMVVTMLFPVMVFAQVYQNDSIALDKLHRLPEFKEYLKKSLDRSIAAVSVGGNALWLASSGNFSKYDFYTLLGLGFAGVGFTISFIPSIKLTEAKNIMISCGFDKIPGNDLYRVVSRAQAMSVAITLAGVATTSLAVYGIFDRSEVAFGIGLGGTIAITFLSVYVPILIQNALGIYNKNAAVSLKLGDTNNGIGMVYHFR